MMNFTVSKLSGFALIALSAVAANALAQDKSVKHTSPPAETSVTINGKNIAIKYAAPSTYGRKIYGELVPYGQVWRAGANSATALTTVADLDFNGLKVPAGHYTIYALPGESDWQLIINKQTGQWGTVYDQSQDLGRVKMNVSKADAPIETYKMTLASSGGNKGTLTLAWENTIASVPFTVK
jgi:hypothetical protein